MQRRSSQRREWVSNYFLKENKKKRKEKKNTGKWDIFSPITLSQNAEHSSIEKCVFCKEPKGLLIFFFFFEILIAIV